MKKAIAETRFKVFIENARLLSEQEISEMPEENAVARHRIWTMDRSGLSGRHLFSR